MSKWFDENGTDIDAYPHRAFQGGVYEYKKTTSEYKVRRDANGQDENPEVNTSEKVIQKREDS